MSDATHVPPGDNGRRFWPDGGMTKEEVEAVKAVTPKRAPLASLDPNTAARVLMVQWDPLLRKLPYEQRTAMLLNLLVTYAAEQPAALQARGRFINAMTEEFKMRLQRYLPINTQG